MADHAGQTVEACAQLPDIDDPRAQAVRRTTTGT